MREGWSANQERRWDALLPHNGGNWEGDHLCSHDLIPCRYDRLRRKGRPKKPGQYQKWLQSSGSSSQGDEGPDGVLLNPWWWGQVKYWLYNCPWKLFWILWLWDPVCTSASAWESCETPHKAGVTTNWYTGMMLVVNSLISLNKDTRHVRKSCAFIV